MTIIQNIIQPVIRNIINSVITTDDGNGGEFLPTSLPNIVLWLDATDAATITESGGAVSEWADKSGNSIDAVQVTGANQPITGTRTVNGLNVLDFDSGVHFMELTSQPITGTVARTIVVVGFADDGVFTNHFIQLSDNLAGDGGQYLMAFDIGLRIDGGNIVFVGDAVESGIAAIVTMTNQVNSNIENNASNFQGYKNGALLSGEVSQNPTTLVNTNSGGGATAFISFDTSTSLNGVLGEVIMYDRVLNSSELGQLNVYLSVRWAIALA